MTAKDLALTALASCNLVIRASYSAWLLVAWNLNLRAYLNFFPSGLCNTSPAPLAILVFDPSTSKSHGLCSSLSRSPGSGVELFFGVKVIGIVIDFPEYPSDVEVWRTSLASLLVDLLFFVEKPLTE
ncbi:hypothetical protein Vadar_000545 [Vaccinium darrowii]|uniref:Uncharacterized protein n=1 Tax=Vaccinium darrowii TaxID=229202 RepID=A0ACB7YRQ6_9ERIC|nr:hypothetical protein Vadar_000545 [Vaccinium darrowii]